MMALRKDVFFVSIEGNFGLTIEELWPNGDAPENPTREDVMKLLREQWPYPENAASGLMREWNLEPLEVRVDGLDPWKEPT